MSNSRRSSFFITAVSLTLAPMTVAAGQSTVTVSPFVSYVPSATENPLAGLALTFGGTTGLALRGSGELSIENPDRTTSSTGYRPWGADADAILFLGGLGGGATVFSRSLSPYLFSGLSLTGGDSAGSNVVRNGWSYGAGATIPLGLDADLFAEGRWRMSEYVLPTAREAPDSRSALRFGLSFHIGGGSNAPAPPPRRRPGRRHHVESYDDDVDVVAAQPATVIVQAPAPVVVAQPAPVVIVMPAPEPEPSTTVNINLPGSVVVAPTRRRSVVYVSRSRSTSRSSSRGVSRVSSQPVVTCASSTATVEARRGRGSIASNTTLVCRAPRERRR